MPILVELIASLVSAALGGTILQTVLKAVVEHEGLRRVAKSIQLRDLVAIMFIGLGVASLVTSYSGWLWVNEPRQDWWQSLHLEVGVALLLIGFVDTLLMSRLGGEKPSGSDQQRDVAAQDSSQDDWQLAVADQRAGQLLQPQVRIGAALIAAA